MRIPPEYKITSEIVELLAKIEANRMFLAAIPIPSEVKNKIQRAGLLKSSLYSARIEGNPLTIADIGNTGDRQKKREVFNILSASRFIQSSKSHTGKVKKEDILMLHRLVMKDIERFPGHFRREMNAIFNSAGAVIYLPPPPSQIPFFLEKMVDYINSGREKFPLISAFMTHLVFEKIHPFIDGNGRTGRLLIFMILEKMNWRFKLNIVLEEYLDNNRNDYYHFLDVGMREPNNYLLFMLEAFRQQSEKIKSQVASETGKKDRVLLPPRQEEIYRIIGDHKISSFDIIRRRFLKVPERTLRYDLKKLQEKKLIRKTGSTKGSFYSVVI